MTADDMDFYEEEKNTSEPISAPVIESDSGEDESALAKSYSASAGAVGDLVVEDEESMAKSYTIDSRFVGELEVENDVDDEDSMYSPEERLSALADVLLSSCVGKKSINKHALDKLMMLPSPNIFRNENYVLFTVLYNYRGKLRYISIDEEFIKLYLNRNRKILLNGKAFIDVSAYGEIDGSEELGYIGGVLKHYKRLVSMEEVSEIEFETSLEKYLIEFKAMEAERVLQQAQTILIDGLTIGRKKYFGFDDSQNYVKRRLAEIDGLVNMSKGSGFTNAREMLLEEKEAKKPYKIGDFGRLEALNKVYGGIYTGMFYQVIAPPKAGKSKFIARCSHTSAVIYGNNISIWAQEGGNEAFLAQLRAIHFDYIYNTNVDVTEKKYGVSQDAILHDKFPNDELKQLEMSSKLDLATNQDYGSIDFIDKPFEVETFLDDIKTSIESNHSVMIVLDYLQLIGSATNMSEREAVSKAYKDLLAYCKTNNIAVLTPGQYKQEAFDKLIEMKNTEQADMRTSGGVSAEVIRTPDIIFAFWATTQDIANNTIKILSMPCRFNKPFPEIDVAINYETCQFISLEN